MPSTCFFFFLWHLLLEKTKPGASQDVPLLHLSNCFLMAQVKFLFYHCICYELKAGSKDLIRFLARIHGWCWLLHIAKHQKGGPPDENGETRFLQCQVCFILYSKPAVTDVETSTWEMCLFTDRHCSWCWSWRGGHLSPWWGLICRRRNWRSTGFSGNALLQVPY